MDLEPTTQGLHMFQSPPLGEILSYMLATEIGSHGFNPRSKAISYQATRSQVVPIPRDLSPYSRAPIQNRF
jgi:hypothetical protein